MIWVLADSCLVTTDAPKKSVNQCFWGAQPGNTTTKKPPGSLFPGIVA